MLIAWQTRGRRPLMVICMAGGFGAGRSGFDLTGEAEDAQVGSVTACRRWGVPIIDGGTVRSAASHGRGYALIDPDRLRSSARSTARVGL